MPDFYIKQLNNRPFMEAQLLDGNGSPVDLTGGSVVFTLGQNGVVINEGSCDIVDALTGRVQYTWTLVNTITPGNYKGEFEYTNGSDIRTFPSDGNIDVHIEPRNKSIGVVWTGEAKVVLDPFTQLFSTVQDENATFVTDGVDTTNTIWLGTSKYAIQAVLDETTLRSDPTTEAGNHVPYLIT